MAKRSEDMQSPFLVYQEPPPDKYTHQKDWGMEGNRPMVCCDDTKQPTTNKPMQSGLVVRQPL